MLAVPENWTGYVESIRASMSRRPLGRIVFTPESLRSSVDRGSDGAVIEENAGVRDRLARGQTQGFWLERVEAPRSARCSGLGEQGQRIVAEWVDRAAKDSGTTTVGEPKLSALEIDGCQATRVEAVLRDSAGSQIALDLRAVASEDTLYIFEHRAERGFDSAADLFGNVVGMARFSAAR